MQLCAKDVWVLAKKKKENKKKKKKERKKEKERKRKIKGECGIQKISYFYG